MATNSAVNPHQLPELKWQATPNCGTRGGTQIRLVVVHRWGVRFTDEHAEARSYQGVIDFFKQKAPGGDPRRAVSAHIVYPGSAVPGEATQMVPWHQKAWAEAYYNPDSVEVESADAIWLGHDPAGFHQLAHLVAYLLHHYHLPPRALDAAGVVHGKGFCRHADLGQLGGGHTSCPTTDIHLMRAFDHLVVSEFHRDGFRHMWGKA
jgi:hypothetical protein